MKSDLDIALAHLAQMFNARVPPPLPEHLAGNPDFMALHDQLQALRDIAEHFAVGDIAYPIRIRGFVAGGLKNLQANLRHLAWQVRQVEKQDFSQRVKFMGEFSDSFNSMVEQLASIMQELEASKAKFKDMASFDALTGAYTRLYLMSDAEQLLREAEESGGPFGLVLMDLDKFKTLNDTHGHQCGDAALRHTVSQLQATLRKNDRIYRYGGEEFVVLLADTPPPRAVEIAERMRAAVENIPVSWEERRIPVTASFGVCCVESGSGTGSSINYIIETADKNLYQAKDSGRNRVVSSLLA